ncbi:MAG: MBOAT family protein [Alphaproteobacteria bacterium]|nr:MBOAT family protein [Alphaproteobacteria bacterium]
MVFSSYGFLFAFLPAVLSGTYLIARLTSQRIYVVLFLLAASVFFYAYWDYRYAWVMLGSILFNYAVGRGIAYRIHPRALLLFGIAANLSLLFIFKYADFFLQNAAGVVGMSVEPLALVLPIGISFFTFHQIAYLVEMYREPPVPHRFPHYALFVSFFPQLISGPIVYPKEMLPQFVSGRVGRFRAPLFAQGITLLVIGLAKKVLVADHMSGMAVPVFAAASEGQTTFVEAWVGTLAYTFQVYFDFSAYSDMAIGLGLLLGIRLPLNFYSPYKARGIIDFWRRWHMTLSRFLRDYLYIPLGGNRRGKARQYVNLIVVMLLGGLWHGANWTFVVWGAMHGAALAINHAWRNLVAAPTRNRVSVLTTLATSLFIVATWVFFRANDMSSAMVLLRAMAGLDGIVIPESYAAYLGGASGILAGFGVGFGALPAYRGIADVLVLLIAAIVCLRMPNSIEIVRYRGPNALKEEGRPRRVRAVRWVPNVAWAVATSVVFVACALRMFETGEFLYFQF